jgi:hypothetical protein
MGEFNKINPEKEVKNIGVVGTCNSNDLYANIFLEIEAQAALCINKI